MHVYVHVHTYTYICIRLSGHLSPRGNFLRPAVLAGDSLADPSDRPSAGTAVAFNRRSTRRGIRDAAINSRK